MTYRIVRFFQDHPREIIETGLTLDEAQAHCRDKEASSSTASDDSLLREKGPWFDGYEQEDDEDDDEDDESCAEFDEDGSCIHSDHMRKAGL